MKLFAGIVIILIAVLLAPFLFLWSLNVLFNLHIEYDIEHLFAALLFLTFINPNVKYSK